ncbi:hypothetical protein [Petropleomorpha daqingensis]|uniref:Uncharacterized protein n=1 Tax=Petropleomorpha daqingensis TaxID=2026353 RepID=A0A853CDN1_9ACTN|nr:hypothetical protein [Petropleomorpha daqingensis]NYJ05199.1 hypothetical protein [Petropleomorpha daqingensis]
MAGYADERRWREENLDWLHEQHEQLTRQTELMERQTATLERISRHTALLYGIGITWIVLTCVALFYWMFFVYGR